MDSSELDLRIKKYKSYVSKVNYRVNKKLI